ncbi:flagellar hook assembly protein FlgD [Sphingomonas sp. MMS12-HWE2-04]|uniref:flagellar hook assembly protein FlgD n=1 Tax=Sphingomonas sp. MMS12-HWE2-04 TaxID=3234199 RepID=UPI00384B46E9
MTTVTSTTSKTGIDTSTTAGTKLSADYDMFLKLLTAQMQNQDPLDPMDTSQYTQQLVQYSQVEQSIEQNTTLKSILSSLGTQNLTQASSLIGRSVETDSATAGLSATSPAQWSWAAPRDVASMTATITDANGRIVDTRTVAANAAAGTLSWDGQTSTGQTKGAGNYTIKLEGTNSGGNALTITPHAIGTVSDVQLDGGNVLVTINGMQVASANLLRIGASQ